jgi:hypothetical protein
MLDFQPCEMCSKLGAKLIVVDIVEHLIDPQYPRYTNLEVYVGRMCHHCYNNMEMFLERNPEIGSCMDMMKMQEPPYTECATIHLKNNVKVEDFAKALYHI